MISSASGARGPNCLSICWHKQHNSDGWVRVVNSKVIYFTSTHRCREASRGWGLRLYTPLPPGLTRPALVSQVSWVRRWSCVRRVGPFLGPPWPTQRDTSESLGELAGQLLIRKLWRSCLGLLGVQPWFRGWSWHVGWWMVRWGPHRGVEGVLRPEDPIKAHRPVKNTVK